MDIGKRRHHLTVQEATRTDDGQGGGVNTWTDLHYEWASARFLSGSRSLDNGGVVYRKAVEFEIRKRTDYTLSTAHRIRWNDEYYTIHSVLPSDKLDDLKILAYV
jgi:SPP1 family predicted phage head-tail adaptor